MAIVAVDPGEEMIAVARMAAMGGERGGNRRRRDTLARWSEILRRRTERGIPPRLLTPRPRAEAGAT